ncbi:Noc3 protein [Martiniozyma asiatica (nom. inval.)]|nr:Noc3 protein [Martiniozyma asiatica]
MAKRKVKRAAELRQNKKRKEDDSRLQLNVFEKAADIEQEYELQPRNFKDPEADGEEGLPVRTADGGMKRRIIVKDSKNKKEEIEPESEPEPESESEAESESENNDKANDDYDEEEEDGYKGLTQFEKIIKTKEDIASMCEKLIEDPEENILLLSRLRRMTGSKNQLTSKLATLSMIPVFKFIAPSYFIRPLTDAEKNEKVGKDVAKLRFFEHHLVLNYQHYVNFLLQKSLKFASQPKVTPFDAEMGIISTNAACELAVPLRFFNFHADVFKIITRRVMRKPANDAEFKIFEKSIKTLEDLLMDDQAHGLISFDVVRLLCKSIKRREFKVDESVINVFLCLTILNDFDPNNEQEDSEPKMKKSDRVYLSKKQRKQRKEKKEIEEELRKAEQAVTTQERERYQGDILKMLLTFYLETLKHRPEKLMAPVLESLSKFGHMVNIDLMGDFLQVLREISEDIIAEEDITSDQVKQVLLCIITSFSLVANLPQRKVVVDLNKFVDYLYSLLPILALDTDIEFSHKTLRLLDPLASAELNIKPNVNVSTKAELLLRCLNVIFFNSKSGSARRALAFTKRLHNEMLQTPEKSSVAIFKFLDKLLGRFSEIKNLYTTEDRVQNGIYNSEVNEIERANTEVAVLWENTLLENHYCPNVAMGARHLMKKA